MPKTKYPPEQKAEALRLLAEVGKAETARITGIPVGTIASWGAREGVNSPTMEQQLPAVQARQISLAKRKAAIAERLVTAAEHILQRADPDNAEDRPEPIDVKRLMDAVGVAMNTAHILGPVPLAQPAPPSDQPAQPETPTAERERVLAVVRELGQRAS